MNNQYYHHETLAAEHFKELGRAIEHERILAQLPHRLSAWRRGVGRAGYLLVLLGTRMQAAEQADPQVAFNR